MSSGDLLSELIRSERGAAIPVKLSIYLVTLVFFCLTFLLFFYFLSCPCVY